MQLRNIFTRLLASSCLLLGLAVCSKAQRVVYQEELLFNEVLRLCKSMFREELSSKEQRIVDSIQIEFDGHLDYSSYFRVVQLSKTKWKLQVSSGFIFKASLTAQMFVVEHSEIFNRKNIFSFYNTLYEPLGLYLVRPYHFSGLTLPQSMKLDTLLSNYKQFVFSTNILVFSILHEVGHIVLGHFNKKTTKQQHIEADSWAMRLIYKEFKNNNRPHLFKNGVFANSVRQAIKLSYYRDDSKLFYNGTAAPEVVRMQNFDSFLDSLYCQVSNLDTAFCNSLNKWKAGNKEELQYLNDKKFVIDSLKPFWFANTAKVKRIKSEILDSIYLKDTIAIRHIKHITFTNHLLDLLDTTLYTPYTSIENLHLLAEALLKGTWNTEPDIENALTIYEIIANLNHWTLFGRQLALAASSFHEYNKWQERAAIYCGLIHQYYTRNYQRAAYYFETGKEFSVLLPKEFYEQKILDVKYGKEHLIRIRSYRFY